MRKQYFLILLIIFLFNCSQTSKSQSDDFQIIKDRIVQEIMESEVNDDYVQQIMEQMDADGSFRNINYEDLSRTAGFPHRRHNTNLVYLARAYKSVSSKHFGDPKVKEHIIRGLKHWVEHDYFGDNWHNNQISTPNSLVELMLLVGNELPAGLAEGAQPMIGRAHMEASGARPSGDRIVIAGILAKNLLFLGNHEEFDKIIRLIEGEVKFSTGSRGMQHDYSFHHRTDRVNNTTSYGYGKYANAFGEWSAYVAGTRYAFSKEKINQLVDYYLDGIYKQMVYGIYTDVSVKNRSITSKGSFEPHGIEEIERLLLSTDYRKEELEEIMKLRQGEIKPSRSFCKFFWQTEHFVFQRPGFYTTVRMFSTRNRNMEEPYNGPGKPTHHRADGTNHLLLRGDEYHNIWPVFDWQKVPGTTILQKPALPSPEAIQKDGLTDFVGAVTDGLYGAVAFDFISPHDQVKAKKSWFFFDEEYVALGSAISAQQNLPVATTVNQTLMRSEVEVSAGGMVQTLPCGNREMNNVEWVHHNQTGYIFPGKATVQLFNQTAEGRWSDITDQKNISKELVKEDVFLLWLNHGNRPDNGSYQYIVIPVTTAEALAVSAKENRGIEILSNTPKIQGVMNHRQGICQIAFYEAGKVDIAPGLTVSADSPGMVMLQLRDHRMVKITVADPSRKLVQLNVALSGVYQASGTEYKATPDATGNQTRFTIDLPQDVYAGKSVVIEL